MNEKVIFRYDNPNYEPPKENKDDNTIKVEYIDKEERPPQIVKIELKTETEEQPQFTQYSNNGTTIFTFKKED